MHNLKLAGLYAFLMWAIPFLSAFLFYTKEGQLTIPVDLFKSIMIVIGSVVGMFLLALYFRKMERNFLEEGAKLGVIWLVINWLLDIVILLPMSKMSLSVYFQQIGLRYLSMAIMAIGAGYLLQIRAKK